MSVYTKTGDHGTTGLLTGERVAKNSCRVEAYGSVDEINSALGLARSLCSKISVKEKIKELQKLNMLLMADLASISETVYITEEHVHELEKSIDALEAKLPPITAFIIAGDSAGGAALDFARTVTRRAERRTLELAADEQINKNVLLVLNRLSDLCFVLMRSEEL